MAEDRQEQSGSPQADIVSLIERSLVAVRRDQSRRRFERDHGDHGEHEHEHEHGEHRHGQRPHGDMHGWGGRGPWGGYPGPFGDSARPGPGRRGRDGSLGRIARFRMLEALAAAESDDRRLSVSSLAAAIGVDQPRASRLVQEGVERGLVRRVPDPSDARRALLQLTAAGRSQLGEVQDHRRSAVEAALASFTPEEARTFADLFDRFVRAWPR
ncbi:MarR family winged helix-turn-helix transcriptional regulator [uncultured Leifsonia sp.]|uniref:MarR family winged helix-turn-helix transcriptional regulator n=1 Tax=uncultured Leifsonia sp. TaxID=340359 RepID=UPI0025F01AF3|nr:MarR family winged helix-turn-helix transcriptional regulator [uncultured Leifsonia sp.]